MDRQRLRGLPGRRTAALAAARWRAAPRPRLAGAGPAPVAVRPRVAWEILLAVAIFGGALSGGMGL